MHSVAGAESHTDMRRFTVRSEASKSILESKLIDAVVTGDLEAVRQLRDEAVISGVSSNQILMQDLVIEAVGIANKEILLEIVDLLASDNLYAYEVSKDVLSCCFLLDCSVTSCICNIFPSYFAVSINNDRFKLDLQSRAKVRNFQWNIFRDS